ncbi:DgyrCDS3328 [Dimorphilus gyrociliatus]|uniref:DgyrCDS3328 n=1 Tax=Dimorphilus gyrociliatus TaxID=2664684 RepID=A0A7I8VDC3_9ANNE|nr:DgyrCDS3328 [Dimorphilus gyrociliatus]
MIKRETFRSTEIPKLREWFNVNRKPSMADLEKYRDILNNGPARIDKYKITVQKLQVWFKNERQKEKISEGKKCSDKDDKCSKEGKSEETANDRQQTLAQLGLGSPEFTMDFGLEEVQKFASFYDDFNLNG